MIDKNLLFIYMIKELKAMKRIKLIIIITAIAGITYGQNDFTFGPELGWTSSRITTNLNVIYSDFKAASITGYQYGAFFRFGDKTYFQPEVFLSSNGGIMNYNVESLDGGSSQNVSQQLTMRTLDLSLLLGHKLISSREFNLRLFIGPVASYVMDTYISLTQGTDIGQVFTKNDFKNMYGGAQGGVGIDLFMFSFDARYEISLNDLSNSGFLNNTRSNVFLVTVGWKIL